MATPAGQRNDSRASADRADRRLLGGLLASLLLHALILLLQFGVPGLGSPGTPAPLTVRLSQADPAPVEPALPAPAPPAPEMAVAPPAQRAATGMQLVDPVAAPPAPLAPPAVKARPKVRKDTPRRAKRISSPLVDDAIDDSVRVIAQDMTVSDFNMPVAKPEEAEEKSVDAKDAQHGDDDGEAAANAALEEQEAIAGKKKDEEAEQARKLAELEEKDRREQEQRAALQLAQQEQRKLLEEQQLAQQKADQQTAERQKAEQQKAALALQEQQQVEQTRQQLQREQVAQAERQRVEQQRVEQQRVEQQRVEQERIEQQRVAQQQRVEQQRVEQQRLEQQRVAEQQRAEQQRAGEQAARDAAQRNRDLAAAQPGSGGAGSPAPGGGAGAGTAQIPKNMMGSDAATRAKDLVRGLDLLRGDPPSPRTSGERRVAVGAGERDLPLKMYAESWRQKIERNASVNFPRSWADTMRIDPLVSVAVRSDGSVEDVTIVVSSGRADMDEAVRRIVRVNARYSPFPPQIAARYDVIEIRRVWRFDDQLRLLEELR